MSDAGEPEDWPAQHSHARELDGLLRCGVCKELLCTPMRLQRCPHLFCSECIRRWMSTGKACCPTCREAVDPAELRVDAALHAVAAAFSAARPALLAALKQEAAAPQQSPQRRSARTRQQPPPARAAARAPAVEVLSVDDGSDDDGGAAGGSDSDFVSEEDAPSARRKPPPSRARGGATPARAAPASSADYTTCPVCRCQVPLRGAEEHVNRCLDGGARPPPAAEARKPAAPVKHPPRLNTFVMSASQLNKLLHEWRLDQPAVKRDAQAKRWSAFYTAAEVARDKAKVLGVPPDYVAVARAVLREERQHGNAAGGSCATLFSPRPAGGRAAAVPPADAADAPLGDRGAPHVYAELVRKLKARAGGGASTSEAAPVTTAAVDDEVEYCGTQRPPDAAWSPDAGDRGKRKRTSQTPPA